MKSDQLIRRIALIAGGAAIVGMGTLTAGCSSTKEEPKTTTPSATTTPSLSATEKVVTNPPPVPSIANRGGMDSTSCGPGQSKVNGVCQ